MGQVQCGGSAVGRKQLQVSVPCREGICSCGCKLMCSLLWLQTHKLTAVVANSCAHCCGCKLMCSLLWLQTCVLAAMVANSCTLWDE